MFSLKGCLIDHLYIITTFFFFWVLPVVTHRDLFGSKRGERKYEEQPNNQKSWERPKLLLFCLDQAFFSLTSISCLVLEINEFIPTRLNLVGAWHQGPRWKVVITALGDPTKHHFFFFPRVNGENQSQFGKWELFYYWLSRKQVARFAISTVIWKALYFW